MVTYVYKVSLVSPKTVFSNKKFEEELREKINQRCGTLGKQGYELVSTTAYDSGNKFLLMFKKKVIVRKKSK